MLRNLSLAKALVAVSIVLVLLVGVFDFVVYFFVPAHARISCEVAVVSFGCSQHACVAEFGDFNIGAVSVPKPVNVGDMFKLTYDQTYDRRTGMLQQTNLISVKKIKKENADQQASR